MEKRRTTAKLGARKAYLHESSDEELVLWEVRSASLGKRSRRSEGELVV
jgi:hypothetical protein